MLYVALAFAQTPIARNAVYEIDNFNAGLNSQLSPYIIPAGGAVQAFNVRVNDKYGALAKRQPMSEYGSCASSAVTGLHRFYKSDSTKALIVASGTKLYKGSDSGGSCTEIGNSFTDGARWQWVTYKDKAIGANGNEQLVKWDGATQTTDDTDGSRTAGDLVSQLGAPFAELNTGSNLEASKYYQYRIAYYDGSNYSYSLARSNPILTGATVRDITLTDIPLGPEGTTQRIIYRTTGQNSRSAVIADTTFYKVATISDNSTQTYNDAIADATIVADAAPTWATVAAGSDATPPPVKLLRIHKERLFGAYNSTDASFSGKSTFYWSDVLNPDYFDVTTDYELVRPDDGDSITGMANQLGTLILFKTNSISKFYTDASSTTQWELSNPFSFIGNKAPYSIAQSPAGIFYRGDDGIYTFNGQTSQLVSDKVTKEVRDMNETGFNDMAGVFFNNEYQLAYQSKDTGSGVNDRVLILDTVRNSYVIDTKKISVFEVFGSGDDFNTLYSGSSDTDGMVFAHTLTPANLTLRYLSDFEAGTADSIVYNGTEDDPSLEIGWGVDIDSVTATLDSYTDATIDRPGTTGTWLSPPFNIRASSLEKLYWNEDLNSYGDVTFAVRTAASEAAISSASWSSEFSNPAGSDISGVAGNEWLQLRATLTTSNIQYSPNIFLNDNFVIKLAYNRTGSDLEDDFLTLWQGGFDNLGNKQYENSPKRIKQYIIYYEGTEGTISVTTNNEENTVSHTFDIDLSVLPADSSSDNYYGNNTQKIFSYIPSVTDTLPTGRQLQFTVSSSGTTQWKINKLIVIYDIFDYIPFP
jgi:hypothetical protein